MPIKYKINVLSALKAVGYSTYRLRQEKIFGERTMQKFRQGEIVNADNMAIICRLLNCQPGDIIEYDGNSTERTAMNIIKYPSEADVNNAVNSKEPLLMLISFNGETVIMSHIDEAMEHHILLKKAGFSDKDTDKYFRIVLDDEGADWTFVCPPDYKSISDKSRRIKEFYKDGFSVISDVLQELGFMVGINIPRRYRRHFDMTGE